MSTINRLRLHSHSDMKDRDSHVLAEINTDDIQLDNSGTYNYIVEWVMTFSNEGGNS